MRCECCNRESTKTCGRLGLAALIVVVLGLLHGCWIHHEWDLRVEKVRAEQKASDSKREGQ